LSKKELSNVTPASPKMLTFLGEINSGLLFTQKGLVEIF
jgi:hypothetical protein